MMDSPVRGFPVSEFEARLKRVQKLMAARRFSWDFANDRT